MAQDRPGQARSGCGLRCCCSGLGCLLLVAGLALAFALAAGGAGGLRARACSLGHAESCFAAGHSRGDARALALLTRACDLGHGAACTELADLILFSSDAAQPRREATGFLALACGDARLDRGSALPLSWAACASLAQLARDTGADAQVARALGRGCDAGDAAACHALGLLRAEGDQASAAALFSRACSVGGGEAGKPPALVSVTAAGFEVNGAPAANAGAVEARLRGLARHGPALVGFRATDFEAPPRERLREAAAAAGTGVQYVGGIEAYADAVVDACRRTGQEPPLVRLFEAGAFEGRRR